MKIDFINIQELIKESDFISYWKKINWICQRYEHIHTSRSCVRASVF